MTCQEFVAFLDDYLAGVLSEEERARFNSHLAECPSCVAYMKTYQAAVEMGRAVLRRTEEPLPDGVPDELVRAILASRRKP